MTPSPFPPRPLPPLLLAVALFLSSLPYPYLSSLMGIENYARAHHKPPSCSELTQLRVKVHMWTLDGITERAHNAFRAALLPGCETSEARSIY